MAINAKASLLLVGTMLYGEPWPGDRGRVALRLLGFGVAATAVPLFPRHDEPTSPSPGSSPVTADQPGSCTATNSLPYRSST
jgi:hypothetical protein